MRKLLKPAVFLCALLMICAFGSILPQPLFDSPAMMTASAEDSVTLSLNNGNIDITPNNYTQSGNTVPFTGHYIIKGSRTDDTPLDIENYTGETAWFNITLDNATLIGSTWCTALRLRGNADIVLNMDYIGDCMIWSHDNHPVFSLQSDKVNACVNITSTAGASLTLKTCICSDNRVTVKKDGNILNIDGSIHTCSNIQAFQGVDECGSSFTYYQCAICGQYYRDAEGKKPVLKSDLYKLSEETLVTYESPPTYTVTIPQKITLSSEGTEQQTIKAEGVRLEKGKNVIVALTEATPMPDGATFHIKTDKTAVADYTISNGSSQVRLGDRILSVDTDKGSGSADLYFSAPQNLVNAGNYTGQLVFTISVE